MELSKHLRDCSRTIAGKEQLLIGAMAKAFEIIPRQLCENAGFDATNILNKLRQSHAQGSLLQSSPVFHRFTTELRIFWVFPTNLGLQTNFYS
jgi:chaperonin GroEL (HSP60 family)